MEVTAQPWVAAPVVNCVAVSVAVVEDDGVWAVLLSGAVV